jgi:hypothetical protein
MNLCAVCVGMGKECLDAVFDLIKAKAKNLHLWRGKARQRKGKTIRSKYLKVLNAPINVFPLRGGAGNPGGF